MRIIALLFFIMCSVGVNAQQVKLSRLERAGGAGYVPYTDVNGKQAYNLLSTLLSSYVTGSGTSGEVAVWNGTTALTSTSWQMSSVRLQGSATGDPRMDATYNFFTFNGDTDTGLKRTGANVLALHSGDATNYRVRIASGVIGIDCDASGSEEFTFQAASAGSAATGSTLIYYVGTGTAQYSFSGDTDTGLRRTGADILGLHAGDATNPTIEIDGVSNTIVFDPDDDGTNDVSISATATTVELLTVGAFDAGPSTYTLGHDGSGNVTQEKITFGQLEFNGTETLTSTTGDTLFNVNADEIEVGDVTVNDAGGAIVVGFTGYAEVSFMSTVDSDSGAFSGDVDFALYVNGAYMAPYGTDVEAFAANERKVVSLNCILPVTSGDVLQIFYQLSTAGTMYAVRPILTVKKLR